VTAGARISRNQKMVKATTVTEKIEVSSSNNSNPPPIQSEERGQLPDVEDEI
jgi:hypothetical protein